MNIVVRNDKDRNEIHFRTDIRLEIINLRDNFYMSNIKFFAFAKYTASVPIYSVVGNS